MSSKSGKSTQKKLLLMGKAHAGKTSMRSIIFSNYVARNTMRLGPTLGVEHLQVRFLNNLVLSLWDAGGQDLYFEDYFGPNSTMFSNVEVLVYVFDVESTQKDKDIYFYSKALDAILQHSENAKIYCLVHKMDLIPYEDKQREFRDQEAWILSKSRGLQTRCFATSIWDESLYQAWSSIVESLIPNSSLLESKLEEFRLVCEADEAILFEKSTFLVLSKASNSNPPKSRSDHSSSNEATRRRDVARMEKLSNLMKMFKLSCRSAQGNFEVIRVSNSHFSACISHLTDNTVIMVVSINPITGMTSLLNINIQVARKAFERLLVV